MHPNNDDTIFVNIMTILFSRLMNFKLYDTDKLIVSKNAFFLRSDVQKKRK